MVLFKLLMLLFLPFTLMFGLNNNPVNNSLDNTSVVENSEKETDESSQGKITKQDKIVCSTIESCVINAQTDERIYKQSVQRGTKSWFYIKADENGNVIVDGVKLTEGLLGKMRQMLKGLKNPTTEGMNSYMITIDIIEEDGSIKVGDITVNVSDYDFSKDSYDFQVKKGFILGNYPLLQFTELSGRCSVFERPLSDAKRPLFF